MGKALDAALKNPPAGVQVWSACSAGQFSHEFDGSSVFLEQLFNNLNPQVLKGIQQPTDPIPVAPLAEAVARGVAAEVKSQVKADQAPQLVGREPSDGAAYDPAEPPPPAVLPASSLGARGDTAAKQDVRAILREIELPPFRVVQGATAPFPLETLLFFSAKDLEAYRADYSSLEELKDPAKSPVRAATLEAIGAIRKAVEETELQLNFMRATGEAVKKEVLEDQRKPARIRGELTEALDKLVAAGAKRSAEKSKRWQAHYDFVHAQLLARIAFLDEYNLMRGKIRKDELPELNPKVHSGWKLASREKLTSGKDVRDMVAESKKLLAKVAKDHARTPWEVLAKRERLTALGLEWQPSR
jgi:hypothetical protein